MQLFDLGNTFLASVLVATSLSAQQPTPTLPRQLAASLTDTVGIDRVDGHVLGFGSAYKALFDRGGIQFTPALGLQAPHNMPLRFTLQSVRRGSQQLLEPSGTSPEATVAGTRVTYDRGAIDEHYDLRPAGVEQSFSFANPLGGDGDLVVRGTIETELVARTNADGSLSYVLPEVGGVHYGVVTGVDASGNRVRGEIRRDGSTIELMLPDAFVDAATYPLILDPLLGVEFLVPGSANSDPDAAYDVSNDVYLAAYQKVFSATDIDVYAQRLDGTTGAVVGLAIGVDTSVSAVSHVRVANVNATNQFLVVWSWAPGVFGPWDVRCRRVDAAAGTMSAIVDVIATTDNEVEPCASSEASTSDNEALVIWRDTTGIRGSQVTVAAAVDPVVIAPVTIGGGLFSQAPCISKSGGAVGRHVVAWHDGFLTDPEIYAAVVDRNLGILAPATAITNNSVNDTNPSVDGNGTSFVFAWQRGEPASSRSDIRMMRVTYSGGALTIAVPDTALEADAGQDEATPDVCYLGQKYGIVYREESSSPLFDDVYLWVVDPGNCERCGVRHLLDGLNATANSNYENTPRCVGHYAGSASTASDEGIVVFTESLDAPPFSGVVIAQRFEGVGPGGPSVNLGGGCGVMGLHDTIGGGFAVGNPSFTFRGTGVPAISLTFISLAVPAPLIPCGPCVLISPLVLTFVPNPGTGTVTYAFPVPCDPIFVGFQMDTQWVAFGTAVTPCPLFSGLSASNIVRSTLGF